MRFRRVMGMGLLLLPLATLLAGCPPVCNDPVSYAVTEPTLGTRIGKITWLQTGEETTLTLTSESESEATTSPSCNTSAAVTYTVVSADGAIDESLLRDERVKPEGTFYSRELWLNLDVERAVAAGVAPELPDLLERRPTLSLTLTREGDTYGDGELRVRSTSDNVALALVEFGSMP